MTSRNRQGKSTPYKGFVAGQIYMAVPEDSKPRVRVYLEYIGEGRFKTDAGKTVYAKIMRVPSPKMECAITSDYEAIYSTDIKK